MVKLASAASTDSTTLHGESRFAAFGTNKVRYVTLGAGDATLVFVHGWACDANFWRGQALAFAGKAKLIFIDLPGHGESDKPNTAYTMDFHARAVAAVVREARIEKAVFIGHSRGAAVLCRVYQMMPEKFAALVSADGLLCRPPGTPDLVRQIIGQFCMPK
jgi:pimeloyl-ACP methyl ester carboxylesterase